MRQIESKRVDILFYGPFGNNIPPERVGGAETGCRRSAALLIKHGFSVDTVEKPTAYYGVKRFLLDYIKAAGKIRQILQKNNGILFYLVGFYDRQLPFEAFLCLVAKRYGCRLIYEPKNGMLVHKYRQGGWLYRRMSDYIFRNSDYILCQGLEYQRFLEELGHHGGVYHPNYISNYELSLVERKKQDKKRVFLYLGRVTPSKNVDVCIEIFRRFHEMRENSELYIIGGAEAAYQRNLQGQVISGQLTEHVHFTGILPFSEIAGYLNRTDYFLFPSGEEFEGHSNSLTEAMAFGVVPVASCAGFNRSVIGDDSLIVSTGEIADYLNVIMEIEQCGRWHDYSEYVSRRVRECYSEDVVKRQYLDIVGSLVGRLANKK